MSSIQINGVTVSFRLGRDEVVALDTVSLAVESGEVVCLVGPSGCGKTTLLNLVAGFLRPTKGEVLVDRQRVKGPGPDRAVVFQADAVFPWLTVRRNLEYGPRSRGHLNKEARGLIGRYLDLMGLRQFENAHPKALSGGMKKRVDLARAYVNSPSVVLLDEPFGALDAMTKAHLQTELMRISAVDEKTVIFVTHDIEEAIYVGDKVVVMTPRPGRVKEVIDVPYKRPRDQHVKADRKFPAMRSEIASMLGVEI
jgi:NitT/TauT family transport system ATP-binding protein